MVAVLLVPLELAVDLPNDLVVIVLDNCAGLREELQVLLELIAFVHVLVSVLDLLQHVVEVVHLGFDSFLVGGAVLPVYDALKGLLGIQPFVILT